MKKLLLLPFVIFTINTLKSQAVLAGFSYPSYTDINPDTLLNYTVAPYTHETYRINIFGDATDDVEFVAHGAVSSGGSAAYINVTSLDPNVSIALGRIDSVFVVATSTWDVTSVAKVFGTGEQINNNGTIWNNTVSYLTDHSGHGGGNKDVNDFIGGDKYLGLKYENSGSISYGWIKVGCPSADSCYLKEFSASPAVVGINERVKDHVEIYPNPVHDIFYLKDIDPNTFNASFLTLKDMLGREVSFGSETSGKDLGIQIGSSVPAGCYLLEYATSERVFSQKIIKTSN